MYALVCVASLSLFFNCCQMSATYRIEKILPAFLGAQTSFQTSIGNFFPYIELHSLLVGISVNLESLFF